MGQKSIASLNKSGISMFWNNLWDDKINYNKNLNKSITNKNILYIILNNLTTITLYRKNYKFYKNVNTNLFFKIFFIKKNFSKKIEYFYKKYNFNLYFSKIWFIKYDNWIILVSFYINEKIKTSNFNNFYNNYDFFFKKTFYINIF